MLLLSEGVACLEAFDEPALLPEEALAVVFLLVEAGLAELLLDSPEEVGLAEVLLVWPEDAGLAEVLLDSPEEGLAVFDLVWVDEEGLAVVLLVSPDDGLAVVLLVSLVDDGLAAAPLFCPEEEGCAVLLDWGCEEDLVELPLFCSEEAGLAFVLLVCPFEGAALLLPSASLPSEDWRAPADLLTAEEPSFLLDPAEAFLSAGEDDLSALLESVTTDLRVSGVFDLSRSLE